MKFGFSTNAFREYQLEETISILANAGYDGIEILLDEPHLFPAEADEKRIKRIRNVLDDHDLTVSNCNAFMLSAIDRTEKSRIAKYPHETELFHHPSFIEPAAVDRQNRIEHTKTALKTAAELNVPQISIQPGGPVPKGTSQEQAMEMFIEALQEVTETAEMVGVDVLVEPEPDLLIETSNQFLKLADQIDSSRVGCNFDVGHFYCVDEDPVDLIYELDSYTGHYHLEDIPADRTHEHTQLGNGAIDINGFLDSLKETGYDGFVTIELYPYEETAKETAHNAMHYLEENGWV
ncbi:sugar phosphate isomerase/epimerase family protein [Haladaptatus pallidirubidus]|uniref:Sugar phosphate isomerase/epimerase n=1 Tax=Haladaptatus pallidirubidus TaxID=1008152 RepID=A0AAV3UIZ8_9EURY|nr:sugar phosphate isomerase/epimerase [Haladaptatus pallidirubidus]